ncbi:galactosylceramide sulfotransferase-like [Saccoglossus kowalevskii]|uniref:Galactosylceramide sulfotransferase-like n=1 Tax=Saccoglossus kowalevskii TaxID=10224 RepID=A0ABM0GPY7_SACKO|nr:PREDICTED: galactosylceramide sulfotransferase-like [Saccoglossus kowalevskii]
MPNMVTETRVLAAITAIVVLEIIAFVVTRHKYTNVTNRAYTNTPSSTIRVDTQMSVEAVRNVEARVQCTPTTNVVFIKTHKTGSTTVASIIERFGYLKNLSFVVPPSRRYGPHILSSNQLFTQKLIKKSPPPLNGGKYYNMLTNHVGYNRPEMEAVIPNATYVTIIRHPVQHFESSFAYFQWKGVVTKARKNVSDPIATFMETPEEFLKSGFYFSWQSHNGQLYDLGFRPEANSTIEELVERKINALNEEMSVVLIMEYFDESLLILMKTLCWTMDDILYLPKGVRKQSLHRQMSNETREKILRWNEADVKLYTHFNRTLWKKISEYGPTFESDLQRFRTKQLDIKHECIDSSGVFKGDARESRNPLKNNATEFCNNLWYDDVTFTGLIRDRQLGGK